MQSIGRARFAASRVLGEFRKKPVLKIAELVKKTAFTKPTVASALDRLRDLGIIAPISEKKWGRLYAYRGYVSLVSS